MKSMRFGGPVIAMMLVLTFIFASPVFAEEKGHTSYDKKNDKVRVKKEMYVDMMTMLKDTMEIVKNMSHKPSEADKEKLDNMIKKLDRMINEKKEMMKKNDNDKK